MAASLGSLDRSRTGTANTVFKSGYLFISTKGIGWRSWKKRWFILTRTSLVFFKNDPSTLPQKGGEVNLTLGGIDLNNSGSVIIREDKKLLTVLFPGGQDGRAFTLKAESLEDLYDWKRALEQALSQAPSTDVILEHIGIFQSTLDDPSDGSFEQWRDKRLVKSMVIGRPILLALEDIDGSPSFLEKALTFLEKFGVKVEGILRQSADVEEVVHRILEYEQGRVKFDSSEDAHVVGDCVKHILRELPSSPVPASCCTALLEAYRTEPRVARITALRIVISETFPEPNRRLLQRILKMMHVIAAHSSANRMTTSSVAACMAPLLLRPLLSGECEIEDEFSTNDDSLAQLLAAANAATHAQAIVTALVEEYECIFDDEISHVCLMSSDVRAENNASHDCYSDGNTVFNSSCNHDPETDTDPGVDNGSECILSGRFNESDGYAGNNIYGYKMFAISDSDADSPRVEQSSLSDQEICKSSTDRLSGQLSLENVIHLDAKNSPPTVVSAIQSQGCEGDVLSSNDAGPDSCDEKHMLKSSVASISFKNASFWKPNTVKKEKIMESFDLTGEEEHVIQRLEVTKNDLCNRIAKEAKENAILQASLERRKHILHERRLALELDVSRLQEQLQAERDLRAALEAGLNKKSGHFVASCGMVCETKAELQEIALAEADVARLKQKVADLHDQLNQQGCNYYGCPSVVCKHCHTPNLHSQENITARDYDVVHALCKNGEIQQNEESLSGMDWRNDHNISMSRKQHLIQKRVMDLASTNALSTMSCSSASIEEFSALGSATFTASRPMERHPAIACSALVELTARLDFFRERRSQLIEQLDSLDMSCGASSSQGLLYRTSPPWTSGTR